MLLELTDANFQKEVLESDVPVLVDFWASWCGPCKILGPIVEEVAADYQGKPVKIAKMEVDANEITPAQYQIMSVPTMLIFRGGKPVNQMVGVQAKQDIKSAIDEVM